MQDDTGGGDGEGGGAKTAAAAAAVLVPSASVLSGFTGAVDHRRIAAQRLIAQRTRTSVGEASALNIQVCFAFVSSC